MTDSETKQTLRVATYNGKRPYIMAPHRQLAPAEPLFLMPWLRGLRLAGAGDSGRDQ